MARKTTPKRRTKPPQIDVPALLREALAHHQAGRLEAAELLYLRILESDSAHAASLANLGMLQHQRGNFDAASDWYARALAERRTPEVLSNLALLQRAQGNLPAGVTLLREALQLQANFPGALFNLGTTLLELGRPAEAIGPLQQRARDPAANADVHANLARALHAVGRVEEALAHGRQTLVLKDQQACAAFAASGASKLASGPVPPFDASRPERNVIAFSLWGHRATYIEGAVANAGLTRTLYPGWTCRIYCDASVPAMVLAALRREAAQVVMMPAATGYDGAFWRFLAAGDPDVDYFLCRDADARLNSQEIAAVRAWLLSGKPFHIMRDAPFHMELILAGMWGGVGGRLRGIDKGIEQFRHPSRHRWADQDFLRQEIWPRIRDQALIHDSYYNLFGSVSFPPEGRLARPHHVGAGYALAETGTV